MTRAPQHKWTAAEDKIVLGPLSIAAIARQLSLTETQVQWRRRWLRRLQSGPRPMPKRLTLPLGHPSWMLAKTCIRCALHDLPICG